MEHNEEESVAAELRRAALIEKALIAYVVRYGVIEEARGALMLHPHRLRQPQTKSKNTSEKNILRFQDLDAHSRLR